MRASIGVRDSEWIGAAETISDLRRQLAAVAPLRSTVLISGETGVGKGLMARLLHRNSPRASAPFIHVDCASISPGLAASELFGHERGSFTGALARRPGRFERVAGGTVFLDEVGDMPPDQQVKLLRVIQDREFERVGGNQTLPMRARVIAATSRDLAQAVADSEFRADLYFRLNVIRIEIPPLRERHADVAPLVAAGLERLADELVRPAPRLTASALDRLAAYAWPGNVRELMNVLERLVVRHPGGLVAAGEIERVLAEGSIPLAKAHLEGVSGLERRVTHHPQAAADRIGAVLEANGGNVARAARHLGIPRSTLRHRIRRYGIHRMPSR